MEAYFKWVNTRKGPDGKSGIHGRKIVWKYYDDGYNPAQTVQLTNKLVLEDKIFADVGSLGTEHNQAIRPMLNQRKIPQILVSTGRELLGPAVQAVPVDDRLAAGLHRGGHAPTASGSRRTRRTRRSRSSTRTTTTARTTSAA